MTAGIAAGASWDVIRKSIAAPIAHFRKLPGPGNTGSLLRDYEALQLSHDLEDMLGRVFERVKDLISEEGPLKHDREEAEMFQWTVFMRELFERAGLVQIDYIQYFDLERAAGASVERLDVEQLLRRIIAEWLQKHPNHAIGLF